MAGKSSRKKRRGRRVYSDELKAEAVQMLLEGHRAEAVASNLGLSSVSLLYRWRAKLLRQSGPAAATLENRVRQLEEDLRRVERERDILKKGSSPISGVHCARAGNHGPSRHRRSTGASSLYPPSEHEQREEALVLVRPQSRDFLWMTSRNWEKNLKKALAIFSQRM